MIAFECYITFHSSVITKQMSKTILFASAQPTAIINLHEFLHLQTALARDYTSTYCTQMEHISLTTFHKIWQKLPTCKKAHTLTAYKKKNIIIVRHFA